MKATSLSFGKKVAVMLLASSSFVASAATSGFKMVLIEDPYHSVPFPHSRKPWHTGHP